VPRALKLELNNLYDILTKQHLDRTVRIKLARLAGDDDFCFYGAEIDAGTRLSAHFHRQGTENYYIVAGSGQMSLGDLTEDGQVLWTHVFPVSTGDCFSVAAGQVHQLENIGDKPLNALFACPAQHLSSDRTMVGEIG